MTKHIFSGKTQFLLFGKNRLWLGRGEQAGNGETLGKNKQTKKNENRQTKTYKQLYRK